MSERGVNHYAHWRVIVGIAHHNLTRSFEPSLAFVGDLEVGSTAHFCQFAPSENVTGATGASSY
jgi:hypothetical protein